MRVAACVLPVSWADQAIRQVFHDLHNVAVRIGDRNLLVPDRLRTTWSGTFDRARDQVLPHPLNVVV